MAKKKTDSKPTLATFEKEQKALVKVHADVTVVISNKSEHTAAMAYLTKLTEGKERALTFIEPQRKSARETLDIILEQKRRLITPYDEMIQKVKSGVSDFEVAEEQRENKELLEAEKKARTSEEGEKEEINEQIKRLRLRMAASTVLVKNSKSKATRTKHEGIVEDCRAQLETLGIERETVFHAPLAVSKAAKSSGSASDWEIGVVDPQEFLRWVLNKGKKPKIALDRLLTFKLGAIKDYVKTTDTKEIPGVSVKPRKNIAVKKGVK